MSGKLTTVLTNYFEPGYTFHVIPRVNTAENRGTVFLLHGWGVRAVSMDALGHGLADSGYSVYNYDYPTSKHSIQEHAAIFIDQYRHTLRRNHLGRRCILLRTAWAGCCFEQQCPK